MLTDLQAKKLTHYFNVLDYNNNGLIQESDFIAIAENLCVLWGFKEGTDDYLMWINTAKREETKQKRLAQMLDELERGGVYMHMKWNGG